MIELFSIAFKDFLTKKFILLSILPLVGSLIILSSFMVLGGNELYKLAVSNTSGDNYFSKMVNKHLFLYGWSLFCAYGVHFYCYVYSWFFNAYNSG